MVILDMTEQMVEQLKHISDSIGHGMKLRIYHDKDKLSQLVNDPTDKLACMPIIDYSKYISEQAVTTLGLKKFKSDSESDWYCHVQ